MTTDYSKFTEKARLAIKQSHQLTDSCHYSQVEPQVLMVSIIQTAREMVFFLLHEMHVEQNAF